MRKHFLLTFFGLSSIIGFAQDSLQTTTLHEVITTASRFEQPVSEVPRNVTVITRDVLEKSIYNSVGEVLANQGGMYIVGATQTPGSNQSLFLRGANSNQSVIMIDGARVSDPTSPNGATELSELSLTNVERIEIIRGAGSTLYGGAAIGGVINIITKKKSEKGFSGNAGVQAGTYGNSSGTISSNINLNYAFEKGLYFTLSSVNQKVAGLNATLDTIRQPGVYKTTDKDDFVKNDILFKTGFKNQTWDVFAYYKRTSQRADLDNGTFSDDDNAYLDFSRHSLQYNATYILNNKWRASLLGSFSNSERQNINDSSVVASDGSYDGNYFNSRYNGMLSTQEAQVNADYENVQWVFGGGHFREKMDFNTYYFASNFDYESKVNYDTLDTSAKTSYAFVQANLSLNAFRLSIGIRYSRHSLFGSYLTYEINPSYKWNTLLLYGSLSSGFNPASLYQLYDPTQGWGAYTTKGNKNLDAEKSVSVELGLKKEFGTGNSLGFSVFRTTTKDVIEYVYLWNRNKAIADLDYSDNLGDTYINIARQITSGIQLDGHVEFGKFYLNGNISTLRAVVSVGSDYVDTKQTGGNHVQLYSYGFFVTDDEIETKKIIRRPNVNAFGELGFRPTEKLSFNVAYRYAGSRYDAAYDGTLGPYGALNQYSVKRYSLFDVGANWQVMKNILLGLKVENIFDEAYQEILGYQTRGRSAYVKLNVRW